MKIGGITWWRNNYGSILQAYALQKYLRDVEELDYVIINQYSKKMVSIHNLMDKLKTVGIKKTALRIIGRFGLKKLRLRVEELQKFVDEKLIVTETIYNESNICEANQFFDGFICGSDQIWNPTNVALDSIYWLRFAKQDKFKIAYAPSIGIEKENHEQAREIKKSLESFNAISSREQSGTDVINRIMGSNICTTVMDPTLLVERNVWDEISQKRIVSEAYVFAYMLKGTKEERQVIEKFAKEKNLPIVTMPFLDGEKMVFYDFKFGDYKLWSASPEEFISAIRYADYVFTDSFHCTVFSCLYHRNFYTFPKQGKNQLSRIWGLQDMFKIERRMVSAESTNELIESFDPINWTKVDNILYIKRKESQDYIKMAIQKVRERDAC